MPAGELEASTADCTAKESSGGNREMSGALGEG